MQTILYAVETIDPEGNLSKAKLQGHEMVVDIPEQFHPDDTNGNIRVEYDEGIFALDDLLVFRGGFPALALWDKDTYKEFDYPLQVVSDRIIQKAV